MNWETVAMICVLALAALVAAVIVYALIEAGKSARHKRDVEWLEAQARTGLTVRKGYE